MEDKTNSKGKGTISYTIVHKNVLLKRFNETHIPPLTASKTGFYKQNTLLFKRTPTIFNYLIFSFLCSIELKK